MRRGACPTLSTGRRRSHRRRRSDQPRREDPGTPHESRLRSSSGPLAQAAPLSAADHGERNRRRRLRTRSRCSPYPRLPRRSGESEPCSHQLTSLPPSRTADHTTRSARGHVGLFCPNDPRYSGCGQSEPTSVELSIHHWGETRPVPRGARSAVSLGGSSVSGSSQRYAFQPRAVVLTSRHSTHARSRTCSLVARSISMVKSLRSRRLRTTPKGRLLYSFRRYRAIGAIRSSNQAGVVVLSAIEGFALRRAERDGGCRHGEPDHR